MSDRSKFFVSTEALAARLGEPDLKIVDASWFLPTMGRDAAAEYAERRIPGAVRFDVDAVADTASPLPHMLPTAEVFAATIGAMGIRESDAIVVYDGAGLLSAPRVWWTFRLFGAGDVKILDGGMPKWLAEGRPVETGAPVAPEPVRFQAKLDAARVVGLHDVVGVLAEGTATVVDARPADRFLGVGPEPRPGVPSGHMPGAAPKNKVISRIQTNRRRAVGPEGARWMETDCPSGGQPADLLPAWRTRAWACARGLPPPCPWASASSATGTTTSCPWRTPRSAMMCSEK